MTNEACACGFVSDLASQHVAYETMNGEVRVLKNTSINAPLLDLVRQYVSQVGSVGPRSHISSLFTSTTQPGGGHDQRPCIVLNEDSMVCLMCTFGGKPPPNTFRRFLMGVMPDAEVVGQRHIHSSPQWSALDPVTQTPKKQWLLALPFYPAQGLDDLLNLPLWKSDTMRSGARFDPGVAEWLEFACISNAQEWMAEVANNPVEAKKMMRHLQRWERALSIRSGTNSSYSRSNVTTRTNRSKAWSTRFTASAAVAGASEGRATQATEKSGWAKGLRRRASSIFSNRSNISSAALQARHQLAQIAE